MFMVCIESGDITHIPLSRTCKHLKPIYNVTLSSLDSSVNSADINPTYIVVSLRATGLRQRTAALHQQP